MPLHQRSVQDSPIVGVEERPLVQVQTILVALSMPDKRRAERVSGPATNRSFAITPVLLLVKLAGLLAKNHSVNHQIHSVSSAIGK